MIGACEVRARKFPALKGSRSPAHAVGAAGRHTHAAQTSMAHAAATTTVQPNPPTGAVAACPVARAHDPNNCRSLAFQTTRPGDLVVAPCQPLVGQSTDAHAVLGELFTSMLPKAPRDWKPDASASHCVVVSLDGPQRIPAVLCVMTDARLALFVRLPRRLAEEHHVTQRCETLPVLRLASGTWQSMLRGLRVSRLSQKSGASGVHHPYALSILTAIHSASALRFVDSSQGVPALAASALEVVCMPPMHRSVESCLILVGHSLAVSPSTEDDDDDVPCGVQLSKIWGEQIVARSVKVGNVFRAATDEMRRAIPSGSLSTIVGHINTDNDAYVWSLLRPFCPAPKANSKPAASSASSSASTAPVAKRSSTFLATPNAKPAPKPAPTLKRKRGDQSDSDESNESELSLECPSSSEDESSEESSDDSSDDESDGTGGQNPARAPPEPLPAPAPLPPPAPPLVVRRNPDESNDPERSLQCPLSEEDESPEADSGQTGDQILAPASPFVVTPVVAVAVRPQELSAEAEPVVARALLAHHVIPDLRELLNDKGVLEGESARFRLEQLLATLGAQPTNAVDCLGALGGVVGLLCNALRAKPHRNVSPQDAAHLQTMMSAMDDFGARALPSIDDALRDVRGLEERVQKLRLLGQAAVATAEAARGQLKM